MIQQQFIDYLTYIYRQKNGTSLSPYTIRRYAIGSINKVEELLADLLNLNISIYEIDDLQLLLDIKNQLYNHPDFQKINKQHDRMYSSGFNRYLEYAEGILYKGIEDKINLLDKPILFDSAAALNQYHEHTINVPNRNRIIVKQIEEACNYMCNIDPSHRTFLVKDTEHQYMEGHHIIPLKNQKDLGLGLDCPANILVLCPTCHRFFHYGTYREREEKLKAIYDQRGERLLNSGIDLDRNQFLELANDRAKDTIIYTL